MEKSANQKWKESGTSLSFKDWINRENKKKLFSKENFIPFNAASDSPWQSISVTPDTSSVKAVLENKNLEIKQMSGYKPASTKGKVLGLDTSVVVISGLILASSIAYYFYRKKQA